MVKVKPVQLIMWWVFLTIKLNTLLLLAHTTITWVLANKEIHWTPTQLVKFTTVPMTMHQGLPVYLSWPGTSAQIRLRRNTIFSSSAFRVKKWACTDQNILQKTPPLI